MDLSQSASSGEDDSVYGDELSSTTSVAESIRAYKIEHGRSYHAVSFLTNATYHICKHMLKFKKYKAGIYILPNDEAEQDRMDIAYHTLRLIFNDKLFFAPIVENPQRILDIGTGTGIWAIDTGDNYPSAQITATDLSPIQPNFVPVNVEFEIDDCNELPWAFPNESFDLIHTRLMNGTGIRDWIAFYRESFRTLKAGGYVESQEFSFEMKSDDDSLAADNPIAEWADICVKGALGMGIHMIIEPSTLEKAMAEAGFVNIVIKEFKSPYGMWHEEENLKEAGKFALVAMLVGLSGLSQAIFTRGLGWSIENMEVLLDKVRAALKQKKLHAYSPVFVVYGQKPDKIW